MKCPNCGHPNTAVIDSRVTREDREIRRRRACESCKTRFTTYERIEERVVFVVKKDKRREAFDREKVRKGFYRACEKLQVGSDEINEAIVRVARRVSDLNMEEVKSSIVGRFVMEELFELDEVAYIRFASVYLRFQNISEFTKHVDDLRRKKRKKSSSDAA